MKPRDEVDGGEVDYEATICLQCFVFMRLYYLTAGASMSVLRRSSCKAAVQVGRHVARSYRRIRSVPSHDIIFNCRIPIRAGKALTYYYIIPLRN